MGSVAHLEGKRTGRPPASKSTPRWIKDLKWVEKHLGDPGAKPPTALAAQLVKLAREQPAEFVKLLALRDAPPQPEAATPPAVMDEHRPDPDVRLDLMPGGFKAVVVGHQELRRMLAGDKPRSRLLNAPEGFDIVAGVVTNRGLHLTIWADALPRLQRGQPIPEENAVWEGLEIRVRGVEI
jgi:hypothetical protein